MAAAEETLLLRLRVIESTQHRAFSFLVCDSKHEVVAPGAVNMNKSFLKALLPQTKFLNDSQAGLVFRSDVDFNTVQMKLVKEVVDCQGHCDWHDALAGVLPCNPVANGS